MLSYKLGRLIKNENIDVLEFIANMKYRNGLIWVLCVFCFLRVIYLDVFVSPKTLNTTRDKLPIVYIITPTSDRLEQKADLTRLSQTLQLVPNIHWIVVEDAENKTGRVSQFLQRCPVPNTHLNVKSYSRTDLKKKFSQQEKLRFHRGTRQRNLALDWLEKNDWLFPSVIYFADDDNSYDIQIFQEMRHTNTVSVWPVGLCGRSRFQSPALSDGKVVGWIVGIGHQNKFGIDMAGFAVNGEFLRNRRARFPLVDNRSPETYFLEHLNITLSDLEPRADNCTKVLVWHTRTQRTSLDNNGILERAIKRFSAPILEV